MRMFRTIAARTAMLISLTGIAGAADIRVLSVDAVEGPISTLAAEFGKESGHRIVVSVASAAAVMEKVETGETHDLVIVSEAAMDQLDNDGLVNPESRVPLASAGGGGAERNDAPASGLPSPERFEGALLSEGSVPLEARAFIAFLASPEARSAWLAAKLEPAEDR
jgi:molybdate transport system substrate-binding protein